MSTIIVNNIQSLFRDSVNKIGNLYADVFFGDVSNFTGFAAFVISEINNELNK